ncbi:MAG: cobalamin biosynthesis protein [Methylovirgula sp.]
MIAIGIGCRRGASKEAIIKLVAEALVRASLVGETGGLFTYEVKKDEAGLMAAAEELGMPLHFLSLEVLQAMADRVTTRSLAAEKALGIPSVAEASALAGCGKGSHLLLPRIAGDGVTCAIAKRGNE